MDEPAESDRRRRLASHLVRAVARVILLLLAIRVGLLLFAPQPDDQRVAWFLALTQIFIDPFRAFVRSVLVDPWNGSILDMLALVAMVGYALLEALLVRAINWERPRREPMPPIPSDLLARATAARVAAGARPRPSPEVAATLPVVARIRRPRRE